MGVPGPVAAAHVSEFNCICTHWTVIIIIMIILLMQYGVYYT